MKLSRTCFFGSICVSVYVVKRTELKVHIHVGYEKVVQLYSEADKFALHYLVKVSLLQIISRLISSFF